MRGLGCKQLPYGVAGNAVGPSLPDITGDQGGGCAGVQGAWDGTLRGSAPSPLREPRLGSASIANCSSCRLFSELPTLLPLASADGLARFCLGRYMLVADVCVLKDRWGRRYGLGPMLKITARAEPRFIS